LNQYRGQTTFRFPLAYREEIPSFRENYDEETKVVEVGFGYRQLIHLVRRFREPSVVHPHNRRDNSVHFKAQAEYPERISSGGNHSRAMNLRLVELL
jgi:hypothetical protein